MNIQRRTRLGWLAAAGALPLAAPAQGGGGRVALVVGQSRLPGGGAVARATADARLMEQALQRAGFSVERLDDPDVGALRAALAQLGARLRASPELGLLHYIGAGFAQPEPGGYAEYWMWCAAAHASMPGAKSAMAHAIPLRDVWPLVDPGAGRALVVTVDGAFNWPFGAVPAGGLRWPDAPRYGALWFGDRPGAAGGDQTDGQQGLFTHALARHVQPGRTVEQVRHAVALDVQQASGGKQFAVSNMDWEVSQMLLAGAGVPTAAPPPAQAPIAPTAPRGDDPKARGRSARIQ